MVIDITKNIANILLTLKRNNNDNFTLIKMKILIKHLIFI